MIVPLIDILAPIITAILNKSILTGTFPTAWKDANVIPLPKKSNPNTFSDYRPISILPFLSKVLEKLVHHQLTIFLNRYSLFNPYQSGFRSGHSTTTALVKITDDIRWGMENRQLTVLTLLDFSNAFNTVDFDILLSRLRLLNIAPEVINWFRSYLSGRRQRLLVDDDRSEWCDISVGVPQGGVLSPLLFSLFIDSITHSLSSSYHMYADDLQLYAQAPLDDLSLAVNRINADLGSISSWSKSFGLRINPAKTQCIVIGGPWFISRVDFASLPPISFDGVSIPFQETVKNLGVLFDRTLSWRPQVAEVSRKVFASYFSLKRFKNMLPICTKTSLAQSLLLSHLDYADVCYPDLSVQLLDKLERLQNLCIRFIFNLRKYDHVSSFRTRLKWLPIRRRRDLHVLSHLYSILNLPQTPAYLKDRFTYHSTTLSRFLRSSETRTLSFPVHNTDFYANSYTVTAIRLWNALPESIRRSPSLFTFKKRLSEHFL